MTLDDVIAQNKAADKKKKEESKAQVKNDADTTDEKTSSSCEDNDDDAMADTSLNISSKQEGGEERGVGGGGYRGGRGGGGKFGGRGQGRNSRRHMPYSRNNNNNSHSNSKTSTGDNDDDCDNDGRSRRVYVGNLSWNTTWRELKDHMKTTGCEVSRADVLSSHDGRSKGCGIVEFETSEGARRAVLTLNDTALMGRQIFVREDREVSSGGGGDQSRSRSGSVGGGGSGRGFASGGDAQSRRCYVGNLSWDVAWQELKDHMRQVGDVVFAEVMTESDGRSKGCGIVEYATSDEAQEAINTLSDTDLNGRMIFVREDRESSSGGPSRQCSVYVGNLAFETSWQDLKDHMRAAGNVDQANVLMSDDGRSKGCGIVQYQKPQEAARAIRELQDSMLHGRPIFVREDREAGGGKSSGSNSGNQLFVGNLSFGTTWKELKDHFRQCGDVERAEVMKGFGTVKFYKAKDAANAIQRLNNVELMGRNLEVRLDAKAN